MVDTLAEIGCFRVWIGSESGSQRILDAMERGVTVEQVQNGVALCRSAGIQSGMFLMWGYEGEELSDIEATVEHVKKTDPDIFFTTVAYPIKGTPYFSEVAERVDNPANWSQTSDREFKLRNRHSRQFYRFADKLLRSEVELKRLGFKPDADADSLAALRNGIAEARAGLQAYDDGSRGLRCPPLNRTSMPHHSTRLRRATTTLSLTRKSVRRSEHPYGAS